MSGQIYSIGYGQRRFETFANLLFECRTQYLIDVRSKPYSRLNPDYTRPRLNLLVREIGITYVYMGDTLGGRPINEEQYDEQGRISYEKMAQTKHFRKGLQRLRLAYDKDLIVTLMCSEAKPEDCHRSKLIGEALLNIGIDVTHVDEKGLLITQNDVIKRINPEMLQQNLFERNTKSLTSRKIYGNPNDRGLK